jgi:chromosome segregation ATPase
MQSGNGIDLAAIHQLLTEVSQTVRGHSERFDRIEIRLDRIETRLDRMDARLDSMDYRLDSMDYRLDSHTQKLHELVVSLNEHTRKLDQLAVIVNEHSRKIDDLSAGLQELRATVHQYNSSVISHGLDISELDTRMRRLERRPADLA